MRTAHQQLLVDLFYGNESSSDGTILTTAATRMKKLTGFYGDEF